MNDTRKRRRKLPVRQVKTAADKLQVREIEAVERGKRVKFFRVEGYLPSGQRMRKRFKTLAEAEGELATQRINVTNEKASINTVHTQLSVEEIRDAEGALTRLSGRYTLGEAVEYFLRHYAEPTEPQPLPKALAAFLDEREKAGVRMRSLTQLKATISAFVAWFTIDQLPAEFRTELNLAIAEVGPKKLKSAKAILDVLEANVPAVPVPAMHQATTPDIQRFLRSIGKKQGVGAASNKTWNNYRADLHAFFAWAADRRRRHIRENPVAGIEKFKDGRGLPSALNVKQAQDLMAFVAGYEAGKLVPYFALALFAGLRTGPDGELHKLAKSPDSATLVDLENGVIHVLPGISKTHHYRQVIIRSNLKQWLKRYPGEILPKNHDRLIKAVRSKFGLGHDVLRHTFFSMHVAAFKSVGEAAIEGGNTESVVKRHYLNLSNYTDGKEFWKIAPSHHEGACAVG